MNRKIKCVRRGSQSLLGGCLALCIDVVVHIKPVLGTEACAFHTYSPSGQPLDKEGLQAFMVDWAKLLIV